MDKVLSIIWIWYCQGVQAGWAVINFLGWVFSAQMQLLKDWGYPIFDLSLLRSIRVDIIATKFKSWWLFLYTEFHSLLIMT